MAKLPSKRALLKEVAPLTHDQRTRRLAILGREHAGTPELRALLDKLDGDLHEWQLRLIAATAARESSDLLAGLDHPLRSVRSAAVRGLRHVTIGSDELRTRLLRSTPNDRTAIIKVIRARGDTELADRLIGPLFERFGARTAASLLPACTPASAHEWLPRLDHGVANWASIARAQPDAFLTFLRSELNGSVLGRSMWWNRTRDGIVQLALDDPAAVFELWTTLAPPLGQPAAIGQAFGSLMGHDPDRALRSILDDGNHFDLKDAVRRSGRRLANASDETLTLVAERIGNDQRFLIDLLTPLAPSRREALFEAAMATTERSQLEIMHALAPVLPHAVRHREARRQLETEAVRQQPAQRLEVLTSLAIDEVWDELRAATEASDASLRAAGYNRLVRAAVRSGDRSAFDRMLDELQRLANDQDPVRSAAFTALAEVSPTMIDSTNFTAVENLVRFAVEARDTSGGTTHQLRQLVVRIMTSGATPERRDLIGPAADAFASLVAGGHIGYLGPLHQQLPRGGAQLLFDALESRLVDDVAAERFGFLFALTSAMGPRAFGVEGLQDLLADIALGGKATPAQTAIRHWLADPTSRSERVGRLAASDVSAARLPEVFDYIARKRQDLLDDVLGTDFPTGRWANTARSVVPSTRQPLWRWNPAQRRTYARKLRSAVQDEHRPAMKASALHSLGRVPEAGHDALLEFVDSDDVLVAEAALGALAWTQRPGDALETLLARAGGDRARVAAYAATRASRFADPATVTSRLRAALADDETKLTARKEILRILGDIRPDGSVDLLREVWAGRPLHRDLSIALASALRNHPELDLTWEVLGEMATGSNDEALALVQAARPLAWPRDQRARLAALVVPLLEHRHHTVSNAAWLALDHLLPSSDLARDTIIRTLTNLDSWTHISPAADRLRSLLMSPDEVDVLTTIVSELVAQSEPPGTDAGAERDRPLAQRLELLTHRSYPEPAAQQALRAAASVVAASGYPAEAARFIVAGAEEQSPVPTMVRLAELSEEHPDARWKSFSAVPQVLGGQRTRSSIEPGPLLDFVRSNADAGEGAAMIAVAVTQFVGADLEWPEPWRSVLRRLREHDSPWVAGMARATWTARETPTLSGNWN